MSGGRARAEDIDPYAVSAIMTEAGHALPPDAVIVGVSVHGVRVLGFSVPHALAWDVWRLWRQRHAAGSGWYPLLSSLEPRHLASIPSSGGRPGGRDALPAALERDPDEIVGEIVAAVVDDTLDKSADQDDRDEWLEELVPERLATVLRGTFQKPAEGAPRMGQLGNDEEYWLCLVEASYGYELPVLLPGLPHTPNWWIDKSRMALEPSYHLAFLRTWHTRFGADPYYLDGSRLKIAIAHPPLTPLAAAHAAIERFAYCSDGIPDLPVLADGEVRSRVWTFWWD